MLYTVPPIDRPKLGTATQRPLKDLSAARSRDTCDLLYHARREEIAPRSALRPSTWQRLILSPVCTAASTRSMTPTRLNMRGDLLQLTSQRHVRALEDPIVSPACMRTYCFLQHGPFAYLIRDGSVLGVPTAAVKRVAALRRPAHNRSVYSLRRTVSSANSSDSCHCPVRTHKRVTIRLRRADLTTAAAPSTSQPFDTLEHSAVQVRGSFVASCADLSTRTTAIPGSATVLTVSSHSTSPTAAPNKPCSERPGTKSHNALWVLDRIHRLHKCGDLRSRPAAGAFPPPTFLRGR